MSDAIDRRLACRSGEVVDVTDDVALYQNGKSFECECGQGIGVGLNKSAVTCAKCGKICVDREYSEREPPERQQGQSSLSRWC